MLVDVKGFGWNRSQAVVGSTKWFVFDRRLKIIELYKDDQHQRWSEKSHNEGRLEHKTPLLGVD